MYAHVSKIFLPTVYFLLVISDNLLQTTSLDMAEGGEEIEDISSRLEKVHLDMMEEDNNYV